MAKGGSIEHARFDTGHCVTVIDSELVSSQKCLHGTHTLEVYTAVSMRGDMECTTAQHRCGSNDFAP